VNIQGRTALVVVDFQGGDLSSSTSAYATDQLEKAQAIVAGCRAADVPVVWIQEVHKPHLTDMGRELDGSEGQHCIEGWSSTDIAHGLDPLPTEHHVKKRRYSSFFATELDIVLKGYGVDSLVLIGGFTDICILYTAMDADQRDFRISVVADVVSGSSQQAHDDALTMIAQLQDGALVTSDDVLGWVGAVA
jgi:biuret amidohydrolase